jgi:DNA polymerase-3 subunit alpha
MPGFVHLHVHSSYSLLEGAITIPRLAELAKADRQPALALTDTDNLFGALEFSEKMATAGVQPIVGCALAVDFADQERPQPNGRLARFDRPRLVLLAAREAGYRNLMRLNTRAFLEVAEADQAHVKLAWLEAECDGLIALSGGPGGPLDLALCCDQPNLARSRCETLARLFPDRLYIEVQRHGMAAERAIEPALLDLAYERGLPLVATNEPYFASREDYEAHDALLCIAEGRLLVDAERRQLTPEHCFKSRAEMRALFADLPEAVASTVEIAQRCAYRPRVQAPILPRFLAKDGATIDENAELRSRARAGLQQRIESAGVAPGHTLGEYEERLAFELRVIEGMNYPGYFLIVADFIQWAKGRGIPVGPGRGSGAGSLVSYALTITDLDPIRFGLLFERFLNPDRVSMPDFDIDFCQDRRDEVIAYVQQRYGQDRVAQIITFGTLQARGVLRDVGRVLQMPYGQVDKLCKLVPQNPLNPVTLGRAIADEPRLQAARDSEPVVRRAFDIAQKLEGLHRHASTHAAGIVIGERALTDMVPLYRDPKSPLPITQFSMKWIEQAGLVKFDFLGLKTLTLLQTAVSLLRRRAMQIDLAAIPLNDEKTYAMLARAEAMGVFQLESQGMRRALLDMRPDRFEDIIALVALYRPGPMANIPTYCARKHRLEQPNYIHPKLELILRETFGVIVYQEQVMQAAQVLAGYSLGEADLLRRAMGKKIRSEMQKQRSRFVAGCVERGIGQEHAEAIFDLLERFADYGFNKSHAAAYALVAYQSAYLKANFPVEFLAASMTLDMGNTDKLSEFRSEAERLGVKVERPSINRSGVEFEVDGGAVIHYALAALKGVGRQAVEAIVAARGDMPFSDVSDFAKRIDPRAVNKRVVESLAAAGAFDDLEPNRAAVFAGVDLILAHAQREHDAHASGAPQFSFGVMSHGIIRLPNVEPWSPAERLQKEFEAVGFFLTGHPLDEYAAALKRMHLQWWADFARVVRAGATGGRLAATVLARTERRTRTGGKIGIVELSDPTGHYEAVIFSEGLQQFRDVLEPGAVVSLSVSAELQGEEIRVRIQAAEPLDRAAARFAKCLRVFVREKDPIESVAKRLQASVGRQPSKPKPDGEIALVLMLSEGTEVEVKLSGRFDVTPQMAGAIKAVPGVVAVEAL